MDGRFSIIIPFLYCVTIKKTARDSRSHDTSRWGPLSRSVILLFFIYNLVVMQRASQNLGHHEFPGVCFIRFSLCVCVWVFSRCGLLWKDTEREKRDREKGVWWIDKLPTPLTTLFGNWQQQTRSPLLVRFGYNVQSSSYSRRRTHCTRQREREKNALPYMVRHRDVGARTIARAPAREREPAGLPIQNKIKPGDDGNRCRRFS